MIISHFRNHLLPHIFVIICVNACLKVVVAARGRGARPVDTPHTLQHVTIVEFVAQVGAGKDNGSRLPGEPAIQALVGRVEKLVHAGLHCSQFCRLLFLQHGGNLCADSVRFSTCVGNAFVVHIGRQNGL